MIIKYRDFFFKSNYEAESILVNAMDVFLFVFRSSSLYMHILSYLCIFYYMYIFCLAETR